MTIDEIVTLIQAVSDNGLTSFVYEEGDQKLVLKKKKKAEWRRPGLSRMRRRYWHPAGRDLAARQQEAPECP